MHAELPFRLDGPCRSKGKVPPMLKPRHGLLTAFSCLALLITIDASAQVAGDPAGEPVVTAPMQGVEAAVPVQDSAVTALVQDEGDESIPLPAVDITLNQKVLSYIRQFTTTRRRTLEDGLTRGSRYLPMIQSIFREQGLPEELIYLPLIESAFRTKATSKAGATGMWQFMSATATFNGLSRDWYIDERSDPEKSTRAAARLLKTLFGMFGDWHLALAAYNAGAGRVQKAMKRSKKDNYWDLTASTRYLPRETREYVPLFLASLVIARNPLEYGFTITNTEAPPYDVVSVTSPLDLRRVAEWIGSGVETLEDLNPELRRWTTPVLIASYSLKVPAGTGELVQARLAEGAPSDLARHVVKKNDTLAVVARKLSVTRRDLADANYLPITATLRAGDALIIPRAPTLAPVSASAALAAAEPSHGPFADATSTFSKLVYLVQPGDTIDSIARAYRTSVAYVMEWNDMVADGILPGMELTIFADSRSIR